MKMYISFGLFSASALWLMFLLNNGELRLDGIIGGIVIQFGFIIVATIIAGFFGILGYAVLVALSVIGSYFLPAMTPVFIGTALGTILILIDVSNEKT